MEFVKIKPTYPVHLNPRCGDAVDRIGIGGRPGALADLRQQVPTCCVGFNGVELRSLMEG